MSSIGNKLTMTIFGESHAEHIGVKLLGLPRGIAISTDAVLAQMARRAPGNYDYATPRKEADLPEITSGITNGITTGELITAIIHNTNVNSKDYDNIKYTPRPAHADYTAYVKYGGNADMRGGGQFSGRLTAPLVYAGAVCRQLLEQKGIKIAAHVKSIGNINDCFFDPVNPDIELMDKLNKIPFAVIDDTAKQQMIEAMSNAKAQGDSLGGTVELAVTGLPVGVGGPLFDGIEGKLSSYLFGIPAVKGVEFGAGFRSSFMFGSQNNDAFIIDKEGKIGTKTNNCGGILGGISNGMPIILTVAFKPTPSISKPQKTVDLQQMCETELIIHGRHDPCVVPRAVVCVESAVAVALTDMLLQEQMI